jgi:coenzyme F420-0:L-glutamate ligase/coenzyme F420-1:gamma-L-glutamate ligase
MSQAKNKKYDIIIGIPTYNEADSISNTVSKIDRSLVKYFPKHRSLIINIDSQSFDETSYIFSNTKTKTEKLSISLDKQGKGANIFALLKISKKLHAKYVATIDADITTITEKWPKFLLDSIVKNRADFVAPIYTRNRYEGNTTNHFCLPLLYAWFGQKINQPIGGDFAFNRKFIDYIIVQEKNKDSFLYGIDIFLSTHALGGGFRIKEKYLGRKIHKSSFEKIIPMFQQVAATTFFVLSKYKNKNNVFKLDAALKHKARIDFFIRKPEITKVEMLKQYAVQKLKKLPKKNIQKYLGLDTSEIMRLQNSELLISKNEWIKILFYILKYIHNNKMNEKMATSITSTISPFFFLRTLEYFEELNGIKNKNDIDKYIFKQTEKLRKLVLACPPAIDLNKKMSYSKKLHSTFQTKQKGGKRTMNAQYSVTLTAIPGIPLIKEGDDLGDIIIKRADAAGIALEDGDVLVITSKIVSKAEGRLVSLSSVQPSKKAQEIARVSRKDPRIVELMMRESQILNAEPGIVETLHRLGFICTSGGIDRANTAKPDEEKVSLLPINPDESAQRITDVIACATGKRVGVVINDSLGIKYRAGSIGLAIGVAEIPAVLKGIVGETDLYGKKRNVNISFADEIAAAGSLLMGQSKAGLPVVLIRGLHYPAEHGKLADLLATEQLKNGLAKNEKST